jgi:hypothetical protein
LSLVLLAWGYCCEYTFPITDIAEEAIGAAVDPVLWLAAAGAAYWVRGKRYGLLYAIILGMIFIVAMHYVVKALFPTYLRLDYAVALGLGRFLVFMFIVSVIDLFLQWRSLSKVG